MKSSSILANVVYLLLISTILGFFIFQLTGLPSVVVVQGSSMEPTLSEGDIVFVVTKRQETISIGEIMVFRAQGKTIVHRVINTTLVNGTKHFITKGDANPTTDQDRGLLAIPPKDVHGVLFSLQSLTLKIPKIGLIYVVGNNLLLYWTSGRISILIPCVILGLALIATSKKEPKRSEYPFSRSPITKETLISIAIFTVIIIELSCSLLIPFRLHSYSLALAVETDGYYDADFPLGPFTLGSGKNVTITLYAASAIRLPSKGLAYIEGNITHLLEVKNDTINITPDNPINRIEVFAYVSPNSTKGIYTGKLSVYNRPLWAVLPFHTLANSLALQSFFAIIALDLISNLLLVGCLVLFQLLFLKASDIMADSLIWNYSDFEWIGWRIFSSLERMRENLTTLISGLKKRIRWSKFRKIIKEGTNRTTYLPSQMVPLLLLLCLPSYLGYVFVGIILSSILPTLYMIFIKKWVWKPDITMVSVASSLFASMLYVINGAVSNSQILTIWSGFSFFAPALYTSLICLSAMLPLTYLSTFLLLKWAARSPDRSLNILSDWDVIP